MYSPLLLTNQSACGECVDSRLSTQCRQREAGSVEGSLVSMRSLSGGAVLLKGRLISTCEPTPDIS
jgi:hypothetical protein